MIIKTLACLSRVDSTSLMSTSNLPLGRLSRGLFTGNKSCFSCSLLLLLLLDLFRISVKEHIDHDIPAITWSGYRATKPQNLTGEHPPNETNRVLGLVVCRDGNINEFEGSICVTESNDGYVDIGRLTDGLVIHTGVGNNDKTRLLKRTSDVVSERTGGETTSDCLSTGVSGEFQDGTVTVRTSRNDTDIIRIFDSSDDTSSEDKFLPSLANVKNVNACEIENTCETTVSRLVTISNTPSALLFQTYGSICLSQFLVPMWLWAASRSLISSSFTLRQDGSFEAILC